MDNLPPRAHAWALWLMAAVAALSLQPTLSRGQGSTPAGVADSLTSASEAIGTALPPDVSPGQNALAPAGSTAVPLPGLVGPRASQGETAAVGLASVNAYSKDTEGTVELTAAARLGDLTYPDHYAYLQVDLLLPGRKPGAGEQTERAYEYAIVAAHVDAVPEGNWVPLLGTTLRIASLPYGRRDLRVRSHPPGLPARIDVPLTLHVPRPWYRHSAFVWVVIVLVACAFFAYRRSWQRDLAWSITRLRTGRYPRSPRTYRDPMLRRPAAGAPGRTPEPAARIAADVVFREERGQPDRVGAGVMSRTPSVRIVAPPPTVHRAAPVIDEEQPGLAEPTTTPQSSDAADRERSGALDDSVADPEPTTTLEAAALAELRAVIAEHFADPEFSTERLADRLAVSKRTLSRMTVPLTGLTPGKLIAERRLERARELIEADPGLQVKAVAASVGYRSADGFARAFRDRFGASPSSYSRQGAGGEYVGRP